MKKVKFEKEKCIYCGQCQAIAPEVFKLTDELEILLEEIHAGLVEVTQEAIDACPTLAIGWEDKTIQWIVLF